VWPQRLLGFPKGFLGLRRATTHDIALTPVYGPDGQTAGPYGASACRKALLTGPLGGIEAGEQGLGEVRKFLAAAGLQAQPEPLEP
jgi:hypothetical protein